MREVIAAALLLIGCGYLDEVSGDGAGEGGAGGASEGAGGWSAGTGGAGGLGGRGGDSCPGILDEEACLYGGGGAAPLNATALANCESAGWTLSEDGTDCTFPTFEDPDDCRAVGGEPFHGESLPTDPYRCIVATPDAGVPCSDPSECAGWCEPPSCSEHGDCVSGNCSATNFARSGCYDWVTGGRNVGRVCE